MSIQKLYRVLCDAPRCTVTDIVEKISDTPSGWTRLDSRDHHKDRPAPMVGRGRHRRPLSTWDMGAGGFCVILCPEHPLAFDGHHPQTTGGEPGRRGQDRLVRTGCSCGWGGGSVRDLLVVGQKPTSTVERAWLGHLPEALRWYATREASHG